MKDFNSIEFAWKDIEVEMLGRVLFRVTEIEYTYEVDQEGIYGRGGKVLGIQEKNAKASGKITVGQSELEAMTLKAKEVRPGAKLTSMMFNINVAYIGEGAVIRDRIVGAKINSIPKSFKQGDAAMSVTLSFTALDVDYNV